MPKIERKDITPAPIPSHQMFQNLIGKKFSDLTIIALAPKNGAYSYSWYCKCKCGSFYYARGDNLRNGKTRNCGCGKQREEHGLRDHPMYMTWVNMRERCNNPKNKSFRMYGAKGIRVCDRWNLSFTKFLDDMGERPLKGASLERINYKGNYEPGNVKWAGDVEQANNTSRNVRVTIDGIAKTRSNWCGGSHTRQYKRASSRVQRRGWCDVCAITLPLNSRCKHKHQPT